MRTNRAVGVCLVAALVVIGGLLVFIAGVALGLGVFDFIDKHATWMG